MNFKSNTIEAGKKDTVKKKNKQKPVFQQQTNIQKPAEFLMACVFRPIPRSSAGSSQGTQRGHLGHDRAQLGTFEVRTSFLDKTSDDVLLCPI